MSAEKVTVSVIKADVGSVVGHSRPHPEMLQAARDILKDAQKAGTIEDFYVTRVGDDINLFMSHFRGENNPEVHKLGWDAFTEATKLAKQMKLYGAGQDILTDAFSGNIKGAGPGSAEMSFEERPAEPVIFFMADKTEPSAYSLPLSRIYLDPFTTTGLVIDAKAKKGFDVEIHDVLDHKKVVMSSPEETLSILSLLGDTSRYAIKRISSRAGIGPACVVSTDKLNLTAGKYVGKVSDVTLGGKRKSVKTDAGNLSLKRIGASGKELVILAPAVKKSLPVLAAPVENEIRSEVRGAFPAERNSYGFLLGKRVTREVSDIGRSFVLMAGTLITDGIIKNALKAGKIADLVATSAE